MAKRKTRHGRPVGYEPNNICPNCGRKVKMTFASIDPVGFFFVRHWWSHKVCQVALSRQPEPVELEAINEPA